MSNKRLASIKLLKQYSQKPQKQRTKFIQYLLTVQYTKQEIIQMINRAISLQYNDFSSQLIQSLNQRFRILKVKQQINEYVQSKNKFSNNEEYIQQFKKIQEEEDNDQYHIPQQFYFDNVQSHYTKFLKEASHINNAKKDLDQKIQFYKKPKQSGKNKAVKVIPTYEALLKAAKYDNYYNYFQQTLHTELYNQQDLLNLQKKLIFVQNEKFKQLGRQVVRIQRQKLFRLKQKEADEKNNQLDFGIVKNISKEFSFMVIFMLLFLVIFVWKSKL